MPCLPFQFFLTLFVSFFVCVFFKKLQEQKNRGVRVFGDEDFSLLTRVFGREDARVVGVKAGSLAAGIEKRLIKEGDSP